MEVKAELKYLRIAPRKVRLISKMIKGKEAEKAQAILRFAVKRGAKPVLKLLNSALASATNNFQLDPANLYIKKIMVDGGPKFKRWRPRSRGMTHPINKRTSHVTIVLEEIVKGKKLKKTKIKKEELRKEPKKEEPKEEAHKEQPKFKPEKELSKPKSRKGLINKFLRRKSF